MSTNRAIFRHLPFVTCANLLCALSASGQSTSSTDDRRIFHQAPRPLAANARTTDWRSFLGPGHNATSPEQPIRTTWPEDGPSMVWEVALGESFASPAIADDHVVLFHRLDDNEQVECRSAENGTLHWQNSYPTKYKDRYGFNNGPRCSPVIGTTNRVVTYGAEGVMSCFDLTTGTLHWRRDLKSDFKIKDQYFGIGATPLILDEKIIVNVGGANGPCVAALDLATGKTLWEAGTEWGPSYAAPIPAKIHGRQRVLVFAGGDDKPPTGGLLVLDPADGTVTCRFPFRSKKYESVNAASPAVAGNNVFLSTSYNTGGVLLEIDKAGECREQWRSDKLGLHFMTPIFRDGYLYGCDGEGKSDAALVCLRASDGREMWRTTPEWTESLEIRGETREIPFSTMRCQLLAVEDVFLCLTEMGHLLSLELSPAGLKIRDRARLFIADETFAMPVLSRGLLFVNQFRRDTVSGKPSRLICYDLRGE